MATWQRSVDIGVAVLFGALTLPIQLMSSSQVDTPAVAVVAAVVMLSGALALRRMAPALALGIAWVGAALQMATGQTPYLVDLAIFGVLYATAAYGSRRTFWAGLASAIGGSVVATVYLYLGPFRIAGSEGLWTPLSIGTVLMGALLFALTLSWTIGALVRTARRAQANSVAQELAEAHAAAEAHRAQIARDMHDVVAHSLAVVIAQADGARYAAVSDPTAATAALATISVTARAALTDVRLLLAQLRHREGDGPQPSLADLDALYAQVRSAGAQLSVDVDPAPMSQPPAAIQLAVYRILQEALTNAMRYGGEEPITVRLAWHPDRVELAVWNVRRGSLEPGPAGHGIIGMRERAQLVGGVLDVAATEEQFSVTAAIPLETTDDEEGGHA
jgi:signal transduction histidine kinase